MNMKKILALVLSAVMVISLAGCDASDKNAVKIGTGILTGQLNAAYATEEGDILASSLIMPSLYLYDRNGTLLLDAAEGKTTSYEGTDYTYKSIANISKSEDKENNKTTYTIKLGAVNFSNGTVMTADDLIFTYYVLCDKSFDGVSDLKNSTIDGLLAYQFNNSQAPDINITYEEIAAAINHPSDELISEVSTEVIKPVLEEGKKFCDENWERYQEKGYGNSSEEFFVMLFTNAIDSEYTAEGKTYDQIFDDTLSIYKMNYKQIARIFYGDVEYLDEKAENVITEYLFNEALEDYGGSDVNTISGIVKKDDRTVQITVTGTGDDLQKEICDIPVLSKEFYGNGEYNYDSANFGITRGDVSVVKSHSSDPLGYGPYVPSTSTNDGTIFLEPNKNYTLGEVPTTNLKLIHITDDNKVSSISDGETDLSLIDLSSENLKKIESSSDSLNTLKTNGSTYDYFGFNIGTLIPRYYDDNGNDVDTAEEGKHLRLAIGILIASLRDDAINNTIGDAGKIIQYPCSTSSIASISETDSEYKIAFSTTSDGEEVTDAIESAKKEFALAGYEFDSDGKLIYKDNQLNTFTVAIPSYLFDDACMMTIYDDFAAILDDIGFKIEPTYYEEIDEFLVALTEKSHNIWLAECDASIDKISDCYHSFGDLNYFGLANDEIDSLLDSAAADSSIAKENYQTVYKKIMDFAIEVPIYQGQSAVIYNSNNVNVDENANITEFYNIFDVPSVMYYPGKK